MEQLLKLERRPTAVVASNDLTAIGVMRAIDAAGGRVPQEMSVVGFDDIWLARYTHPPLTTVQLSRTELGQRAFYALAPEAGHGSAPEDDQPVTTQLIVRESTRRIDS